MPKLKLIYNSIEGVAIPDGKQSLIAAQVISSGGEFTFSNEMFLCAIRSELIKRGLDFDSEDIELWWDNELVGPENQSGKSARWPKAYCDMVDERLTQMFF
jgi:hypothetical protein